MGFGQALSGLAASASNLDIIGNNIANSGTVGFKSSTGTFADIYASAAVGLGTQLTGVVQNFKTGNLSVTGNPYDLAVDGQSGFFRVQDPSGTIKYTRNGQFLPDNQGYLVNAQGDRLTAYALDGVTLQPVRVPSGNIAPRATQNLLNAIPVVYGATTRLNLTSGATPTAPLVISPTDGVDPATFNHALPINIYDSQGNAHQVIQYFSATATANEWDVSYVTLAADGTYQPVGTGKLTFDGAGLLTGNNLVNLSIDQALLGGGVDTITFDIDYSGSTQFGNAFNYDFTQTGYATGEFAGLAFDPDGGVIASYTNGQKDKIGTIVLADFTNVSGLKPVGGNAWLETTASGQPVLGAPGGNGLSPIVSMAIEESNVDLSKELVNLIIAQRTYQANSQTIKTQDQILQSLINLR